MPNLILSYLCSNFKEVKIYRLMGKGDKKSKRGKIVNGTWGTRRKRKIKKRPTIEEKINPNKKK